MTDFRSDQTTECTSLIRIPSEVLSSIPNVHWIINDDDGRQAGRQDTRYSWPPKCNVEIFIISLVVAENAQVEEQWRAIY